MLRMSKNFLIVVFFFLSVQKYEKYPLFYAKKVLLRKKINIYITFFEFLFEL